MTRAWIAAYWLVAGCASAPGRPGASADQAFRAHAPESDPVAAYTLPPVHVATLPNGLQLVVLERHAVHLAAVTLVLPGGTSGLHDQSSGALWLLEQNLTLGAGPWSEQQLFDEMTKNLIDLRAGVFDGQFSISFRAPSIALGPALRILHAVALQPALAEPGIEVTRRRALGVSSQAPDNPELIARRNLLIALYGPGHPYTRLAEDRTPDLTKVTRADLEQLRREIMDPAGAALVVVGDVDAAAVRASVEAVFADWQHDPANRQQPSPAPPPVPTVARLIVVDHPGAQQTKILCGATTPTEGVKRRAAELLAYDLLGGLRSSALAAKLREEMGATWQAGVQRQDRIGWNTVWWYGDVSPERTGDVLKALDAALRELHEHGPRSDELAVARSRRVRLLPHAFEKDSDMAKTYGAIVAQRRPLDSLAQTTAAIQAMSAGEVRAATPDPLAVKMVVVGDLRILKPQLLGLGWGTIEVHDDQGRQLGPLIPGTVTPGTRTP